MSTEKGRREDEEMATSSGILLAVRDAELGLGSTEALGRKCFNIVS